MSPRLVCSVAFRSDMDCLPQWSMNERPARSSHGAARFRAAVAAPGHDRAAAGVRVRRTEEEAAMSRRKTAHPLIDQAAEQAAALVDTVTPHVEAARDRLLDDYVPQ